MTFAANARGRYVARMTDALSIMPIVRAAYGAVLPAAQATWLPHFFYVASAAAAMALLAFGFWPGLLGLAGLFAGGVAYSLSIYRHLLGTEGGSWKGLALANSAIYLAFGFIGFFFAFFLALLPGFLLMGTGVEVDGETPPAEMQEAVMAMLATPTGLIFWVSLALSGLALSYLALRLTLYGAATVEAGSAKVFETWPWTKGHALRLGAVSLATHIAPFAVVAVISYLAIAPIGADVPLAIKTISQSGEAFESNAAAYAGYAAIRGALGAFILPLFLLPGHAMAATALKALKPVG